jgi:DnaA-homolog protein
MRQIPLAIGTPAPRTFESFAAGGNALVIAHLQALGAQAAPVYLWGPSGTGKTHLLEAVAHRLGEQGLRTGWLSAADAAPWAFDDAWSLVVIDNVDALGSDQQHAAFTVFVEATTRGTPILSAGRVPPVDLPLREDLRTRLAWGHVFALEPLAEPEVRATLRRAADQRGIFLSDDVMDYLLTRFARDLKYLNAQLDRLDEFSMSTKRQVTVPLLKQMHAEDAGR